jgi:hypothetical protein
MKKILPEIHQKIGSIGNGLLQYKQNGEKKSLRVMLTVQQDNILHCSVAAEDAPFHKLLNKNISLVQKEKDNYMYISGRISGQVQKKSLTLSIDIKKACWFIRQSKGSVTWLQEKCIYLPEVKIAS